MEDLHWSFGFGSNMDVNFVEKQKGVKIIGKTFLFGFTTHLILINFSDTDHKPAILSGYRLSFSFPGYPLFEPAFGNVIEDANSEVHGVAFGMDKKSAEKIVAVEPKQYKKRDVSLKTYEGQELKAFIFVIDGQLQEKHPSKRYMGIIIEGARRAGLNEEYVKKLEQIPTYKPPKWVIDVRNKRPKWEELPPITVDELAERAAKEKVWYC